MEYMIKKNYYKRSSSNIHIYVYIVYHRFRVKSTQFGYVSEQALILCRIYYLSVPLTT